jgi:dihydropteroate synthase
LSPFATLIAESAHPIVMAIVNLTPDSFSDGGVYLEPKAAIDRGLEVFELGADIVDIGAESTRPGAIPVSEQEELDRLLPVITELTRQGVTVSVDTMKPTVMCAAANAGATMINDVNGLAADGAVKAVAELEIPVCIMHMQGEPRSMQQQPNYVDVVSEVVDYLSVRANAAIEAGVAEHNIILDPGFGFGKTVRHNFELLEHLPRLTDLGFPVLAGVSRKSMIGEITGRPVEQRVIGSVVLAYRAIQQGAKIVRVHDVSETIDMIKLHQATLTAR